MAQLTEDSLTASLEVLNEFIKAVEEKRIIDINEKIEKAKKAMGMLEKNLGNLCYDFEGSHNAIEIILGCADKKPAIP